MSIPDSDLTPLDMRFPIAMTATIPLFRGLLAEWEDRVTLIDQTRRAAEQAMRWEERFVTPAPEPRFVPADPEPVHHDPQDTIVDFTWTDGDTFPSEGDIRPEDTDTFLVVSDQALADEIRAAERRPLRRAWRWLRGT